MNNQPFDPFQPANPYQNTQPTQNPYPQTPAMVQSGELTIRDSLKYGFSATFSAFWMWLAISLVHFAFFSETYNVQELLHRKSLPMEHMMDSDEIPLLDLLSVYFAPQSLAMAYFFNFFLCTLFAPLFLAIALVQIDGLKFQWANIKHRLSGSRGFAATALLWLMTQTPVGVLLIFFLDFPYHDPATDTVVGSLDYSIFVMLIAMACSLVLAILLFFAVLRVLDGQVTIVGALRESFSLIIQHPFKIIAGLISLHTINLLIVVFTCGVGALLVWPVHANFLTHLYRQLIHERYMQIKP